MIIRPEPGDVLYVKYGFLPVLVRKDARRWLNPETGRTCVDCLSGNVRPDGAFRVTDANHFLCLEALAVADQTVRY